MCSATYREWRSSKSGSLRAAHDERRALDARQQLPHVHLADRASPAAAAAGSSTDAGSAPRSSPERGDRRRPTWPTAAPASGPPVLDDALDDRGALLGALRPLVARARARAAAAARACTSARAAPGCEAANIAARPQPSAAERRAGCADPAAAITARTSSTCSSSGEAPATPSDIPVPAPVERDQPRERGEPPQEPARPPASPRRSRCSTGTPARATMSSGPRRPPGRRSAAHRCGRTGSGERPSPHPNDGAALASVVPGRAPEPDLVAIVIAVRRLADAVGVRLALGRLQSPRADLRDDRVEVVDEDRDQRAAGAARDPPRCTATDRRPASRRPRSRSGRTRARPGAARTRRARPRGRGRESRRTGRRSWADRTRAPSAAPSCRIVSGQHVARPVRALPLGHGRGALLARHEPRALDELHPVDVARAVREHLRRRHPHDELRARPLATSSSRSSMLATPLRRSRDGRSAVKSMNSMPTCGLTSRLPIDRYMPLPS